MKTIFEAVDCTDEEMYFTIGLWPSLEGALVDIEDCNEPSDFSEQDHEEYCRVEIRERDFGFSDTGIKRAVIEWKSEYDEGKDEYFWQRKPAEITAKL